jgi:hypothetical protein
MDREADGKIGGELLRELFSAFEDLETQSAGVLQFLKGKGLATDEELAPYLRQAGDASNVRWRAARIRMEALLAAAIADAEEEFARKGEERGRKESAATKQMPDNGEQTQQNSEDGGGREPGRAVSGRGEREKNEATEANGDEATKDETKRDEKESPTAQVEAKKEAAGSNDDSPNSGENATGKEAA